MKKSYLKKVYTIEWENNKNINVFVGRSNYEYIESIYLEFNENNELIENNKDDIFSLIPFNFKSIKSINKNWFKSLGLNKENLEVNYDNDFLEIIYKYFGFAIEK